MFSQPRADKCYGASNKLTPDIFVVSFYNLPSEIYKLLHSIIHHQVATDALASNYTFLLELQLFFLLNFSHKYNFEELYLQNLTCTLLLSLPLYCEATKDQSPWLASKQNLFSVEVLALESGWRQNDQWASRWDLKAFANFLKTNLLFWLALLKTKLYVLYNF